MRVVGVTVTLEPDTALRAQAYEGLSGDPLGVLVIGEHDAVFYGSPAALRRLASEAVSAAGHAEELGRCGSAQAA